jgi:hypothetical protein
VEVPDLRGRRSGGGNGVYVEYRILISKESTTDAD